jgi:hypothetical protein
MPEVFDSGPWLVLGLLEANTRTQKGPGMVGEMPGLTHDGFQYPEQWACSFPVAD